MGSKPGTHPDFDKIAIHNQAEDVNWNMINSVNNITPETCCFTNWLDGIATALEIIETDAP